MVRGIHRVMSLCVIVLLSEIFFGTQTMATDNRVKDLAKQAGVRILQDSTSDKALQKAAADQVPLRRMSQRSRQRALHLLESTSQYRRMPTLQYEVDASLYQYLINHPDVAIATWRVMGISKLNMWQTAPFEYAAQATDGSEGRADVLWRDANQCLFVVEGAYHSPLLPGAIEASALVWLRYRFERTPDNKVVVSQQIETFINFPSAAIEAIAKLASMVTNSILDRNVMEVSLYAQMMSRAVHKDPRWVEEVSDRMEGVPDKRKIELARVAHGLNPYEQQSKGWVASSSANSGRPNVRQAASPDLPTDSTLSNSKQQLLHAVRTGNVVVIVKPGPKKPSQTVSAPSGDSASQEGVSLGSAIKTAVISEGKFSEAKQNSRTVSISDDTSDGASKDKKPVLISSAQDAQTLEASGPIAQRKSESQPFSVRTARSGDSKDGESTKEPAMEFSTGPVPQAALNLAKSAPGQKRTGKEEHAAASENDQPEDSQPTVSTDDQPALVVLPPVSSL